MAGVFGAAFLAGVIAGVLAAGLSLWLGRRGRH